MQNTSSSSLQQQSRTLLLFLVVVSYIVTFATWAQGDDQYSAFQLIAGIIFGCIYLIFGFFDAELLRRFPLAARNAIYFSVQCALVLGIGMALGPGGNWLIGIPLVGLAVERLSPRSRWYVYISVLLGFVLPILRYSTWIFALTNTFIIATAIAFVAIFTQVRVNERFAREKAESLAAQLESANRRLTEYASQAEELAATQERNRLAREIHDNLGHYLTIVNVQIEAAKITCESEPARALDALNKAQELAKKGLNAVRESVAALRVSPMENRPLRDALAELVDESQLSGIQIRLSIVGDAYPVESKSALALYRVMQEGLTNVRKHSHASNVDVRLDFSLPDRIRLSLWDNGVGAADTSGGFGLIGLRERVRLLGGEFTVTTQPNQGFRIEVILPLVETVGENNS
jgi:signal transduction histidine kinase